MTSTTSTTEQEQKEKSTFQGLSSEQVEHAQQQYGFNEIIVKKRHPIWQFFSHFLGPIPLMIEVAAILSLIERNWMELGIILFLLVFNSFVGFYQEYQAGNAIEELKKKLARQCRVFRNGQWKVIEARELVPNDVIRIRLGDIVPADVKLVEGQWVSIDQAALTGESLPVTKKVEDIAYSGSIVKQGEMIGVVTATGSNTYFGKTTQLVATAQKISHFQKAVLQIGTYLIYMSFALVLLLMTVQVLRGDTFSELLQFVLILVVASIPVAMPAVLSVTMAKGALILAKLKAIVTQLESIEEMAGLDVLCTDKTGTLTKNKLEMKEPVVTSPEKRDPTILYAALASKAENQDSIDDAVLKGMDANVLSRFHQKDFIPFDPIHKKTEAVIEDDQGKRFFVAKGAPQVILTMSSGSEQEKNAVRESIEDLARKGYRTLGVAYSEDRSQWDFTGLIPLADPLWEDSASTIQEAQKHGVDVKMITGDNYAIAKEIANQLNMKRKIIRAQDIFPDKGTPQPVKETEWESISGFCEVYPEHKFAIVKSLQDQNHITGMTGDGVNDAPALKQADVGIAVSEATDAARSAASLVLTAPGLSVIINAIEEARRIFERMNSYAIYRIAETIRIMFFIVATILIYNFYPLTAIMVTLLAVLNDIPIMTISYDNALTPSKPVRWHMARVLTVATVLGAIGIVETLALLIIARSYFEIPLPQLQTIVFLKLILAGHFTLFVARTKDFFFQKPYPSAILLSAILGTQVLAILFAAFGILITPIPWSYIAIIWFYCFFWIFIEDFAKVLLYRFKHYTE
ncbi:MAG: plasma-membrane proton-efflux P-type ATPase [Chlamydiales bacterium]